MFLCTYVCSYVCTHVHKSVYICFTGPSALTVNITKNVIDTSVFVQWNAVDDFLPTSFIVTWTSERDHIAQSQGLEEQSSYTITELTLDTVYTITVTATNKCGTGLESVTSTSFTTGKVTYLRS